MTKTILITGANAGLGKECARQLALAGGTERVYLGCRDLAKADAARADLETATGKRIFHTVHIDTMDLASVRAAAAALPEPVEALVMNAGGMGGPTPGEKTADGATHMFAANVLGHALLVDELVGRNKLTRVAIYAGSEAARGVGFMGMKRPDLGSTSVEDVVGVIDGSSFGRSVRDPMVTYGPTKYVAALWMGAMARKWPSIRFVTVSPGGTAGTEIPNKMGGVMGFVMKYVAMPSMSTLGVMHPLEVGARRYVNAVNDDAYRSGIFYASVEGKLTGELIDQATIVPDLANPRFQDNASAAIHRFIR